MKRGFIKMTKDIYENMWSELYIFFKDFRPTHIEFRHWENDIWYLYGVSDLFDEIKEGEVLPQYDVIFTRHKTEKSETKPACEYFTYEFKRLVV